MSLYGYDKKTTPFLDSVLVYSFNAISPTNQTRFSIPIELTDATVQDFDKFNHSQSIITSLKDCGYETYWITNQGKTGTHDTSVTSMAKEADNPYFLNELNYEKAGYDGKILPLLESIDTHGKKKQAFFFHLIGSHASYSSRYPVNKALFSTVGLDEKGCRTAQYDNTIYYTDYIISQIYKRFNNERALYIYLSDHSEVVDKNKRFGHGFSPSYQDEYKIPLVIWSKKREKLEKLYKNNKGKIINTESFKQLVEYMIGKTSHSNLSYSEEVLSISPKNIVRYSELIKDE